MRALVTVVHLGVLLVLPLLLMGVIQRVKARWAGRKGPRLLQPAYDLARLLGKQPVYSDVTTVVFRAAPLVVLASTLVAGLMTPLLGGGQPLAFGYDFIAVVYLWGLGRIALMLGALDTGSSFEGMGASREATYGALIEPVLLLTLGTLALASGHSSLAGMLELDLRAAPELIITVCSVGTLLVVLQIECGRVPVNDPTTHLELTMIHEVMVLDHSGPELAALQYAGALKLTLCAGLIAALVNPVPASAGALAVGAANVALMIGVAVAVALVESLVARLRMRAIPQYTTVALIAAGVALLTAAWARSAA